MKTIKNKTIQVFVMFLIIGMPCAIFAGSQDHVITAEGSDIVSFTDDATTWGTADLIGSIALSWTDGLIGDTINGGNIHLVVKPFPSEGDYKISLKKVTASTPEAIYGEWAVEKNGVLVCSGSGCIGEATGLNGVVDVDTFKVVITDGSKAWAVKSIIGYSFIGVKPPTTVKGTLSRDSLLDPLAGVKVKAKFKVPGSPAEKEKDSTSDDGTYVFDFGDLDPVNFKKVVMFFQNTDADVVFKGYIGIAGRPLEGATVVVTSQVNGHVWATATVDANGLYELHVVGAVNKKINGQLVKLGKIEIEIKK